VHTSQWVPSVSVLRVSPLRASANLIRAPFCGPHVAPHYREVMTVLSYDRYCDEIVIQADLLSSCLKDADLAVPVPSCPGWSAGRLVRHLGDVQRWAETTVRTRATGPLLVEHARGLPSEEVDDPAILGPWLAEGAGDLAQTLRAAGAGAPVWTPVPGGTTDFYARRFTHETAMHRADATLAVGSEYALDQDVAVDAVDEWLELGSLPVHFEVHPAVTPSPGAARTRRRRWPCAAR